MAAVLALTSAAAVRVWDVSTCAFGCPPATGALSAAASDAYPHPPLVVQADVPSAAVALSFTRRPENELRE